MKQMHNLRIVAANIMGRFFQEIVVDHLNTQPLQGTHGASCVGGEGYAYN